MQYGPTGAEGYIALTVLIAVAMLGVMAVAWKITGNYYITWAAYKIATLSK